ncbi:MAG: hypothetical protein QOJ64_2489 [Acidobacteriota bacterium]|nr:hypothetical protein [Acidobacteriota bacterium]
MSKPDTPYNVQHHFAGKDPVVQKIYSRVLKAVRQFGPVVEDPKKTSIHLVNKTALAGIATRKSYLILTVKSDCRLNSSRIQTAEQVSAHRFHHQIKLSAPEEIDAELIGWLKSAHALSA